MGLLCLDKWIFSISGWIFGMHSYNLSRVRSGLLIIEAQMDRGLFSAVFFILIANCCGVALALFGILDLSRVLHWYSPLTSFYLTETD